MSITKRITAAIVAVIIGLTMNVAMGSKAFAAENTENESAAIESGAAQTENISAADENGSESESENKETAVQENVSANNVKETAEKTKKVSGKKEASKKETIKYKTVTKTTRKTIKVRGKANGRGKIRISWSKIKGSKGYKVYRSTKASKGYKRVFTTKSSKRTKWTDKRGLKINKVYYYKVSPVKKSSLVKKKKVKVAVNTFSKKSTGKTGTAGKADSTKAKVKNKLNAKRVMKVKATAYSGGGRCANGKKAKLGRIAVDPRVVRLGTWVYIEGYGIAQACDTGGAIKGKRVDLYFNSSKQCSRYGRRTVKMYVLR